MSNICTDMSGWAVQSPEEPGFHAVITPDECDCREARIYRLNLQAGDSYTLESGNQEMHPVLCEGQAALSGNPECSATRNLRKRDKINDKIMCSLSNHLGHALLAPASHHFYP